MGDNNYTSRILIEPKVKLTFKVVKWVKVRWEEYFSKKENSQRY
jgi:hypothetical protein